MMRLIKDTTADISSNAVCQWKRITLGGRCEAGGRGLTLAVFLWYTTAETACDFCGDAHGIPRIPRNAACTMSLVRISMVVTVVRAMSVPEEPGYHGDL